MPANSETSAPGWPASIVSAANAAHANAEALADQAGQTLAGGQAHARADFLRHEQGDLSYEQHPQQVVAVARAGDRVGRDSARIVVGEAGDDARSQDGQDRRESGAPAEPARQGPD
jgi:hypothetical protein